MTRRLGWIALLLLTFLPAARAQEITGKLEGRVLDADDNGLAGVVIVVDGPALQGERGTTTDARGVFRMPALPVGSYRVTARHVAYTETTVEDVVVRLGKTTFLPAIRLELDALEMPPVVVQAERPRIEPTPSVGGGNIDADEFEYVPTERNYRSVVALLPQANVSFLGDEVNVAGSTGLENMYYIDGINVTDPYVASTATNLPYNFIEEIELKVGGYQAEFGRATGGIVNVITRSGSNEFGGDVFGYYTSDSLAGDAELGALDMNVSGFSDYDVGVTLGGPIVKDRLWYFIAYDRAVVDQDVEIPGFGFFPDERTIDTYAGKLNWKVGTNTDLELTAFGDPTSRDFVGADFENRGSPADLLNPDPLLGFNESGGSNISLRAKTFVGTRWLIAASVARNERRVKTQGATEPGRTEPILKDLSTGTWEGGWGSYSDVQRQRWLVRADATVFLGHHTVKFGVQFGNNSVDDFFVTTSPGEIEYTGTRYNVIYSSRDVTASNRVPTVFVQDAWRLGTRWHLDLGLRWDGQYIYGTEGRAQTITDQWQPRLGLAYLPGRLGTQKLYGTAGRFYGEIPLFLPTLGFTSWQQNYRIYLVDPREEPDNYILDIPLITGDPYPEIPGLRGESIDEFVLGYERTVGSKFKFTARGMYRTLNDVFTTAFIPGTTTFVAGNPGSGDVSFLDEVERKYTSLELTFGGSGGSRFDFLASYVLARAEGNFPGLYDSDNRLVNPNNSQMYRLVEQMENNNGLLPNDRPHAFKLFGSYRLDNGLSFGASTYYMSGTPLNEFGGTNFAGHNVFLVQRGTAGRTASIWDLNLRMQYQPSANWSLQPTFVLDVLHAASRREAVVVDQLRYLGQDGEGNPVNPNPNHLQELEFQPPMLLRAGVILGF